MWSSERRLDDYLRGQLKQALDELARIDPDVILTENVEVVVASLLGKHMPVEIIVDWDDPTRTPVTEVSTQVGDQFDRNIKLLAFAMGASFGGLSGGMFAAIQGFVSPESFVLNESIMILAMVVLGGMGNIFGVIAGAVLLSFLPEILRYTVEPVQMAVFGHMWIDPEVLRMLIFGLALVLTMRYRPAGLWPESRHRREMTVVANK